MLFAENPSKIKNIVSAQMEEFQSKYHPVIDSFANLSRSADGTIQQDMSPKARGILVQELPKNLRTKIIEKYIQKGSQIFNREEPEFSQEIGVYSDLVPCVKKCNFELIQLLKA